MLSNKDIRVENGNLVINGAKYPLDTIEIKEEVDALTGTVGDETGGLVKDVDDLEIGKVDRFVSSSNATTQTIDVGIVTTTNRIFLLSAGYSTSYDDNYVFGLVLINTSGTIKYVSLKDTTMTVSVSYANGIVSITFSAQPYSNAQLIRLC